MKKFSEQINERLKLNKDTKITNKIDNKEWCIVQACEELADKIDKEFKDNKIWVPKKNSPIYVIKFDELKEFVDDPRLFLYNIPDNLKTFEDIKNAYLNDELNILNLDDFKYIK